ncbi:MAG: FtsX-like permease family protein [Nanoarchaeota archaeon]
MIPDLLIISARNLARRKIRSWLTMVGIFISIAVIFTLISISLGLESAVQEQFRQLGTDKFFIEPKGQLAGPGTGGAVKLTIEDVRTMEKVPGVKKVSYWAIGSAKISVGKENRYANVIGIDLDSADVFFETGFITPQEGRVIDKEGAGRIMIGSRYKEPGFFLRGIEVGNKLNIQDKEFSVKAILKPVGNPQDDKVIYMSLEDFREVFPDIPDRIDSMAIQIDKEGDLKSIAERAEKRLRTARGVDEDSQDFIVRTPEELLATFGTILNILTGFLIGIAAISLLVGGIGITNTMYTSVLERTREIGVMKAVGATNKTIMTLFTLESGILGLIGGVAGIILGFAIGKIIEYISNVQLGISYLQAVTPAYLIIGCLAFSFIIGAISGAWPSWRATKIKPVEALRYE